MKIYCSRSELNKALNNVSHSVPARTPSPVLEGILVEVNDDVMKMTATDTNITIESSINVQAQGKCSFVVPAKLFIAIISKLPEEEVLIDFDNEKVKINIRCGGSTSSLVCFHSDDYPMIIVDDDYEHILLSKEDVRNLIRKTAFSASTDDYNGILTGVLLEIREGYAKMAGVDPYRIATYRVEADSSYDVSAVIPARLINEAAKIITDEGDDRMVLGIRNGKAVMTFDNNRVILNTFDGKYIDYERILNKEGNINVRLKKSDLLKSTERASLLASVSTNNLIRFNIEEDLITINSLNEEGNIEEKVEIIKDGDNLNIGINSKYLRDVLMAIDDEEIMLNFKDSISPCIIKPLKGDSYKYLILPIRMN